MDVNYTSCGNCFARYRSSHYVVHLKFIQSCMFIIINLGETKRMASRHAPLGSWLALVD